MHIWSRRIAGTTEAIGDAADRLHKTLKELHLSDEVIYAVELCFEELTTNILRHGRSPGVTLHSGQYDAETSTEIGVSIEDHPDRLKLAIEDNTPPFDITGASVRRIDQSLTDLQPGGLGIHLIKQFSTTLHHELTDTGNRVTVEFAK